MHASAGKHHTVQRGWMRTASVYSQLCRAGTLPHSCHSDTRLLQNTEIKYRLKVKSNWILLLLLHQLMSKRSVVRVNVQVCSMHTLKSFVCQCAFLYIYIYHCFIVLLFCFSLDACVYFSICMHVSSNVYLFVLPLCECLGLLWLLCVHECVCVSYQAVVVVVVVCCRLWLWGALWIQSGHVINE